METAFQQFLDETRGNLIHFRSETDGCRSLCFNNMACAVLNFHNQSYRPAILEPCKGLVRAMRISDMPYLSSNVCPVNVCHFFITGRGSALEPLIINLKQVTHREDNSKLHTWAKRESMACLKGWSYTITSTAQWTDLVFLGHVEGLRWLLRLQTCHISPLAGVQ